VEFRDTSAAAPAAQPDGAADSAGALRVTLRPNGPLRLDGRFEVRQPSSGLIFAGGETALCRCGQSGKKPFCDGTHRQGDSRHEPQCDPERAQVIQVL